MQKLLKHIFIFVIAFVIALACLTLQAELASAQSRGDLVAALNRLSHEIEVVGKIVSSFDNRQAQNLLEQAQRLKEEAATALENREFVVAEAKIKLAFGLLEQAAKVTLDGPARRLRNRLEDLMRRADDAVADCGNKEVERLLRLAKSNQEACEKAFAAREIIKAVEHCRVAIDFAQNTLDLCKSSGKGSFDKISEERQRFENLRERAREAVESSGNKRARQVFDQALKLANSAEDALRKRNIELARSLYNQSMLLLLRAMDMAGAQSPAVDGQIQTGLNHLRSVIDHARDRITGSGNTRANVLFERAVRFENEALMAAQEKRRYEALWKVELAQDMVEKADRLAQGRGGSEYGHKVTEEIEQTREDIINIQQQGTLYASKDVDVLVRMAQMATNRAERAQSSGFTRLALESVLAAQKFLAKAEQVLSSQESENLEEAVVRVKLQQLNQALDEADQTALESGKKLNLQLVNSAREIRQMAVESFENGQYQAADTGIQVAFELIRKSLKRIP